MLSPSDFGMVVLDDAMQGGASGSARGGLPAPTAAVSSGSQRLPVQAQSREQPTRESRAVPESVAVQQNRDVVTVAGVQVTKDSAITVLRAACSFLQVSQSGRAIVQRQGGRHSMVQAIFLASLEVCVQG